MAEKQEDLAEVALKEEEPAYKFERKYVWKRTGHYWIRNYD